MTQLPPEGADGAPDQNQEPPLPGGPAAPPPYPAAPPPPALRPPRAPRPPRPPPPGYLPPPPPPGYLPPTPPPGYLPPTPPPGAPAPPGGAWPGPPGGSPYGGGLPPGDPGYGLPPYAAYGGNGFDHPSGQNLASYGPRLGGWLIDFVMLAVVGLVVNIPLHQVHRVHTLSNGTYTTSAHVGLGGVLIDAAIVIIYGGVLCGSPRGQTVGMMATRVRAVSAGSGAPIGYPRAFGRAAFEYLLAILFFFPWVLDMLFPLWDAQKQTLHDKVSSTVVIKT